MEIIQYKVIKKKTEQGKAGMKYNAKQIRKFNEV